MLLPCCTEESKTVPSKVAAAVSLLWRWSGIFVCAVLERIVPLHSACLYSVILCYTAGSSRYLGKLWRPVCTRDQHYVSHMTNGMIMDKIIDVKHKIFIFEEYSPTSETPWPSPDAICPSIKLKLSQFNISSLQQAALVPIEQTIVEFSSFEWIRSE